MSRRWVVAPSLVTLHREIVARWPDRSTASDGTIGDAAHQGRGSAHNPDRHGIVRARDWDSRDKSGRQIPGFAAAIVEAAKRHPAALLVIHNRTIWSRGHGWRPRPYRGASPHATHVHVSILNNVESHFPSRVLADAAATTRPWGIDRATAVTPPDPRSPIERFLADMDSKQFRAELDEAINRNLGVIAEAVWAATFGSATAGGRLADASQAKYAAAQTRAITRDGERVEMRQEIADAKSIAIRNEARLAGLSEALAQVSAGRGIDSAEVQRVVREAVDAALSGRTAQVDISLD